MKEARQTGIKVLSRLTDAGYEAYFVGGFVRDFLLGLNTSDIDITTDARPDDVQRLFERTVLTGIAFGTVTVIFEDIPFEVTTYRRETRYDNHRHPSEMTFSDSLKEDLSRRDFTINQLVMDQAGNILDHFDGQLDLKKKIIRTINNPIDRFEEDALRMLRAFRFSARLGFDIEEKTLNAIEMKKTLITKIAVERIQDELFKLFQADHKKKALFAMIETGFHETLGIGEGLETLSEINGPYDALDAFTIIHIDDPLSDKAFKFSNRFMKDVDTLKSIHQKTKDKFFTARMLFDHGKPLCLRANHINRLLGFADQEDRIEELAATQKINSIKDLAFKGADIKKNLDPKKPSHISKVLDRLVDKVLQGETDNDRQALKKEARKLLDDLEKSE